MRYSERMGRVYLDVIEERVSYATWEWIYERARRVAKQWKPLPVGPRMASYRGRASCAVRARHRNRIWSLPCRGCRDAHDRGELRVPTEGRPCYLAVRCGRLAGRCRRRARRRRSPARARGSGVRAPEQPVRGQNLGSPISHTYCRSRFIGREFTPRHGCRAW